MKLDEAIAAAKAGNVRNWGGFDTNPEAVATIITAVASGDLIPRPHEYTLSAEAQRIVDTVKDAPQWDTTRDRLASPHGDLIPLADHKLAVALVIEKAAQACEFRDHSDGEEETDFDKGYDQACDECATIVRALADEDALAEVVQVKSDLKAWTLAANNRAIWLQNTRAEVARLKDALQEIAEASYHMRADTMQDIARAAIQPKAAK